MLDLFKSKPHYPRTVPETLLYFPDDLVSKTLAHVLETCFQFKTDEINFDKLQQHKAAYQNASIFYWFDYLCENLI